MVSLGWVRISDVIVTCLQILGVLQVSAIMCNPGIHPYQVPFATISPFLFLSY